MIAAVACSLVAALTLGAALCVGCQRGTAANERAAADRRQGDRASESPSATVTPPASVARESSAPARELPSAPSSPPSTMGAAAAPCRAIRVTGDVKRAGGDTLQAMAPVDGATWLELASDAEVVLRHASSAREFVIRGSARALPCRAGEEHVLLAFGTLEAAPGTGVRPGAEVWIGTPFGTLRYGDARAIIQIGEQLASVHVHSGVVFATPPWTHRGRPADSLPAGPPISRVGKPDPEALTRRCERDAAAARASAAALLSAGRDGRGDRAATQLALRQRARAGCASAAASAARVPEGARRARLDDLIRRADALWSEVPAPLTVSAPGR